jgi:BirA family biotin operon repressor/biotin-[acetyl-CoA-carboxylase] ligase
MQTSRGGAEPTRPGEPWTTPWPGAAVFVKERTASTMDDAQELARSGCPTGTVAAAGYQDRGRGRVPGRTWWSPPWASLLATVVLRVPEMGFPLAELPLRAGAAAALGIEDAADIRVQIKWPNDVMAIAAGAVLPRKIAGLLCEAHGEAALVGIGVNCAQESFPEEIASTACSLLQSCGRPLPPSRVLAAILTRLKSLTGGSDAWRGVVRERLYLRGQPVRVDLLGSGEVVEGVLRDIDERGWLVLELRDGRLRAVGQGELLSSP